MAHPDSYLNKTGANAFSNEVGKAVAGPWTTGVNVSGTWTELYANTNRERTAISIVVPSGGSAGVAGAPYVFLSRSGNSLDTSYLIASGTANERAFAAQSGVRFYARTESDAQIANIRVIELQ